MSLIVVGEDTVRRLQLLRGFNTFIVNGFDNESFPKVYFDCDVVLQGDANLQSRFDFVDENAVCSFYLQESNIYFFIIDGPKERVCLRYCLDENFVLISEVKNLSFLRYIILIAYCLLVSQLQGITIHSSSLVYRDEAVLFLGESGTGKSTHSQLWLDNVEGSWLLNDDCPVVHTSSDGNIVYGSLWSGKKPCFHADQFPLKAIVRLSQGKENIIKRVENRFFAFGCVYPSLPPFLAQDRCYSSLLTNITNCLILSVPVFQLSCLPNNDAAKICCEALFG